MFGTWQQNIFLSPGDKGNQLTGVSNELKAVVDGFDWDLIEEESRTLSQGTEWNFSPANAPWYNGAVEALVKTTKRDPSRNAPVVNTDSILHSKSSQRFGNVGLVKFSPI